MTRNEIIESLVRSGDIKNICRRIASNHELHEDLYQELLLILLEYDEDKIIELHENNQLKYFIVRILKNLYHSKTSTFAYKYRTGYRNLHKVCLDDIHELTEEPSTNDQRAKRIYDLLKDEYWYNRDLFLAYIKEGSLQKLSDKTQIPVASIFKTVDKLKKKLRTKLNEDTDSC